MFELILSSIAALLLPAVGMYALAKKSSAANIFLLFAGLLLSGIEVFDRLFLQSLLDITTAGTISLYLEALLPVSFLLLSTTYGRSTAFDRQSKIRLGLGAVLVCFPLVLLFLAGDTLYYSPDFRSDRVLFLDNAGYWFYLGIMASFILSLANVEATLRETRGMARYQTKFEIFGIMSLLAVLLFYYSQGLLYRTIDMNLAPIRSSIFILAALLMGYSRIFRGDGVRVTVSRHILYRSVTVLAVGIYLIGLGLMGEGMRYFGSTFGRDLFIILAFAGGVLLLAVLFSEKLQRRVKVYVQKHFFADKHDYREEWIKLTDRLTACAALSDIEEAVLSVYIETFGVMGASLYLLSRDEEQYVRAVENSMPHAPSEVRISLGLHSYFVNRERVLEVTDGEHPLSAQEKSLFQESGAWLVVPLISSKSIIGLVLLRKQHVQKKLIYDDYDLMKVLARQAAQAIANMTLSEELTEMRTMAAVARISSFVIHDLKNLISGLSLVVENAEEHMGNPEFQKDAMTTVSNTLAKMKHLMQRLRSIPEKGTLQASVEDIDQLSRETVADLAKMRPGMRIQYDGSPMYSRVDGEEIRKVIVNLVQNALEACGTQGAVAITAGRENSDVWIRVSDNGCGMTEDFLRDHLFMPFRTTKKGGLGIGLYQCRQIVEAHGGRIEVKSGLNKGTMFTIFLPAAETP